MSTVSTKLIVSGILFLLTLITGVLLSRSGRPLNVGFVTVHKLIAIGVVVLIGLSIGQLYKSVDGKLFFSILMTAISAILFIALIATGAFLTREEMQLPQIVLRIHQIVPILALISSTATLYLWTRLAV